jgi:hypothetical protein
MMSKTISALSLALVGLTGWIAPPSAQAEQDYTYGSELMSLEERLGHRELMRRMPPAEREQHRREHHARMMERARALGLTMPPEPPPYRAGAGRWLHSPSQAFKPEPESTPEPGEEQARSGMRRPGFAVPPPAPGPYPVPPRYSGYGGPADPGYLWWQGYPGYAGGGVYPGYPRGGRPQGGYAPGYPGNWTPGYGGHGW